MDKKILIIQFRNGYLEDNEQHGFAAKLDVPKRELFFKNAFNKAAPYPETRDVQAIILGGSGDTHAGDENLPWYESLMAYIQKAIDNNIPVLGICFGHQLLGRLYGARIVCDPAQKELGSIAIRLNEEGQQDALFKGATDPLYSIAGHNDSVVNLPPRLHVLASSDACPIQAFKVNGHSVWGLQFHPELTEQDFKARVEYYKDHYVSKGDAFESIVQRGTIPTNDHVILKNFYAVAQRNEMPPALFTEKTNFVSSSRSA